MGLIITANDIPNPDLIKAGTKLRIPGCGQPQAPSKKNSSHPKRTKRYATRSAFLCPLRETFITSPYGIRRHPVLGSKRFHYGLDLSARRGTPVYAARAGRIIFAGRKNRYGKLIVIQHRNGLTTRYAHLLRYDVRTGDDVKQGQRIALSGDSGMTTGPHLHFEVRKNGVSQNPAAYITVP
jgi:murein DD-endopeptidase MepM/ murein hydrolase activator NlpD